MTEEDINNLQRVHAKCTSETTRSFLEQNQECLDRLFQQLDEEAERQFWMMQLEEEQNKLGLLDEDNIDLGFKEFKRARKFFKLNK